MAIILLEGLDRSGKSSVAKDFEKQGYSVIHLSAPSKELSAPGYTGPSYLDQMVELLQRGAIEDIVLDRTHYGELIWPHIYNRTPVLSETDFDILREIEDAIGVQRILMHDPNVDAHWQRCVDNKEPLTKVQFLKARSLYERMANKYGFEKRTLPDFIDIPKTSTNKSSPSGTNKNENASPSVIDSNASTTSSANNSNHLTPEQIKLEKANAINDVLSKRILKSKGPMYDELEKDIRNFLKDRLGKIFGDSKLQDFSKDEITLLKLFCQRLKEKGDIR